MSRAEGRRAPAATVDVASRRARSALRVGPVFLTVTLLFLGGCGEPQATPAPPTPAERPAAGTGRETVKRPPAAMTPGFAPVRIHLLPLTELTESSTGRSSGMLSVYLSLLDEFGSSVKAPVILRFELYAHVPRSANPKGQRIAIWSDIDLTDPARNHSYWRDFLRAYEFKLDVQIETDETYVLEATCMCLEGRRLTAEFTLKPGM